MRMGTAANRAGILIGFILRLSIILARCTSFAPVCFMENKAAKQVIMLGISLGKLLILTAPFLKTGILFPRDGWVNNFDFR
ncbi:hypothetical protein ACFLX6_00060 [Chloroflexota bacterium]